MLVQRQKEIDITDKLVIVNRDALTLRVPDEKTLMRLVLNLESQPAEYFVVEMSS